LTKIFRSPKLWHEQTLNGPTKYVQSSSILSAIQQLLSINHEHNLRDCRHNRSLCVKADEKNFLIRQLFKDSY